MSIQIAIRIPDDQLKELDEAVKGGEFKSRAEAVRRALTGTVLAELREREIAREYREAYTRHPQDPKIGEAGAILAAELYNSVESPVRVSLVSRGDIFDADLPDSVCGRCWSLRGRRRSRCSPRSP